MACNANNFHVSEDKLPYRDHRLFFFHIMCLRIQLDPLNPLDSIIDSIIPDYKINIMFTKYIESMIIMIVQLWLLLKESKVYVALHVCTEDYGFWMPQKY